MKHQLTSANDDHRQSESFLQKPPVAPRQTNSLTAQNHHIPPVPSAPPPSYPMVNYTMVHPPPYNFAQNIYDAIEPKKQHKSMFFVALLELLLGLTAWSIAVACAAETSLQYYTPLYTGCWAASFYLINAVLGVIASIKGTTNFFVAHIVFSVLSIVSSIILVVLSLLNWIYAGTQQTSLSWETSNTIRKNHEKSRNPWTEEIRQDIKRPIPQDFCVINSIIEGRYSVLHVLDNDVDYANCLYTFKLGVTFNILLVVLAIVLGILNLVSVVLCFIRTCDCSGRWIRR